MSKKAICLFLARCFVIIFLAQLSLSSALCANKTSGKATIYASLFKGKKTANGAVYHPEKMTAASNELPLGAKVLVTDKKTGKKAEVVINDRMSPKVPAVIDLSKGRLTGWVSKARARCKPGW